MLADDPIIIPPANVAFYISYISNLPFLSNLEKANAPRILEVIAKKVLPIIYIFIVISAIIALKLGHKTNKNNVPIIAVIFESWVVIFLVSVEL